MKKSTLLKLALNFWPSFIGNGIHVMQITPDFRRVTMRLKCHFYNRNYFGTHFGGNLFAMTDPFWAIMVFENLGPDYIVWDRRAEIEFIKALREPVFADFILTPDVINSLKHQAETHDKVLHWFEVDIKTKGGDIAAKVRKQVYIKRKKI